ncbi:MAG: MbtH family NRPS accessory protein [Acidobacteria bacterium]|nr:MbtH family NRPS accessory protein [Acidobacteriota bacterium]
MHDDEDTRIYRVVVNHEEQYSIWLAEKEIPLGWKAVGTQGSKKACLAYIAEVWTDMRPLSLRHELSLPPGHAHLWWAVPERFTDTGELARYRSTLTDEERQKADRFRFARDRQICLIARILARATLSRYDDVDVAEWRFEANRYGRPAITSPPSSLRFNLSHTEGMVVCLVARDLEVGVDVEPRTRSGEWLDLADRFFSPEEAGALRRTEGKDVPRRFLEYWTLKEAYIKARGMGLAIPLAHFSFDLPPQRPDDVRIRFAPQLDDAPGRWQFGVGPLGEHHLVATAVEVTPGLPLTITAREAVGPLC